MKEIKEVSERYFSTKSGGRAKRKFKDGTWTIRFDDWEGCPTMTIWIEFPRCDKNKCLLVKRCLFGEEGKECIVVRNRISKMLENLEKGFKDRPLSAEKLARVGSELIPIYMQLAWVLTYDQELTPMELDPETQKPKFTETYREIHKLVDKISKIWREIGIYDIPNPGRPPRPGRIKERKEDIEDTIEKKEEPEPSFYQKLQMRHGVMKEGDNGKAGQEKE